MLFRTLALAVSPSGCSLRRQTFVRQQLSIRLLDVWHYVRPADCFLRNHDGNQQKYSSLCKHKMKCAALLNCICAENIELGNISTPASAPTVAASCSQHLLLALTFKLASRAKGPLTASYFNSTHCDSLIGEARCSQRRVWVRSGSVSELCLSGATALSQGNLKRSLF